MKGLYERRNLLLKKRYTFHASMLTCSIYDTHCFTHTHTRSKKVSALISLLAWFWIIQTYVIISKCRQSNKVTNPNGILVPKYRPPQLPTYPSLINLWQSRWKACSICRWCWCCWRRWPTTLQVFFQRNDATSCEPEQRCVSPQVAASFMMAKSTNSPHCCRILRFK